MINFACTCGERFSFPEELAGSSSQCPHCHRLVDVPLLSEVDGIADDGTIKFSEQQDVTRPELNLELIPMRGEGNEVDRRWREEQLGMDGEPEEIPLSDEVKPAAPKYDPETGMLIRPLEFKPDEMLDTPAGAIPVAMAAPVSYAGGDLHRSVSPLRVGIELFMPQNVLVLVVVMVIHFIMLVLMLPAMALSVLIFLLFPGLLALGMVILSHYSNVVEEVGFLERDEVPTPLRHMSIRDDFWTPFGHFFSAATLSFLPVVFLAMKITHPTPVANAVLLVVWLGGFFVFPAIWLTLVTSGSIVNMRPDRLLGVIRAAPMTYIVLAIFGFVTFNIYLNALTMAAMNRVVIPGVGVKAMAIPQAVAWPSLLTAIYLAHWFAWCVGLYYRANYERFPWIFQRHIRKAEISPLLRRRRPAKARAPQGSAPVAEASTPVRAQPPRLAQRVGAADTLQPAPPMRPGSTGNAPPSPRPVQPMPVQPIMAQPMPVKTINGSSPPPASHRPQAR